MFRSAALSLVAFALVVAPSAQADTRWQWPVRGPVLTAYANGEDPYAAGQHRGVDIGADAGAAVTAATGGEVLFAGALGSSGNVVSVRTADGRFDTSYLHLASVSVRKGESVEAGRRLGSVGTTGTRSVAAPHLHFGVRDAGARHAYHDPMDFLPALPVASDPSPRAVPAPVALPQPVAAVRAPAARALRWGGRVRSPAANPLRLPMPGARPALTGARVLRGPRVAASTRRVLSSQPSSRAAVSRPAAARRGVRAPLARPALGPAAASAPSPAGARVPAAADDGSPSATGHDSRLGWALAAGGLLVAAACVRPAATRRTAERAGAQVRSWLRPLPGRG